MYEISEYTKRKAQMFGVVVRPSSRKNKKIDVFKKNGDYITSIGDIRYKDYPYYLKKYGREYADERRTLYKLRHKENTGIAGLWASKLLW